MAKTKFKIDHYQRDGFVELVFTGQTVADEIDAMYSQTAEIIEHTGTTAILVDCLQLHGRPELGQTFFNVRDVPHDIGISCAIVDHEENGEFQSFNTDAARNIGRKWRWFTSKAEAISWLQEEVVNDSPGE